MTNKSYDIILFDLSGVLVEFKASRELYKRSREELTREKMRDYRIKSYEWVKKLESGRCTTQEFAEGYLSVWPLDVTTEEFLDDLRAWPLTLYEGAIELLDRLAENYTLACLTNTNPIHWPLQRDTLGLGRCFERHYVSYEIGHIKPEPEAYRYAIDDLGCDPGRILFFDDREENVEAARAMGLDAYRTVGLEEVRMKLLDLGILD